MKGFFVPGPEDDGDPVTGHYYETASADPARLQVWGYTDRLSYAPGEVLRLNAMSSAPEIDLRVLRDGLTPREMHRATIPGGFARTPVDCSIRGCGWPERLAFRIPDDWPSGLYRLVFSVEGHESEHMVVVKAGRAKACA